MIKKLLFFLLACMGLGSLHAASRTNVKKLGASLKIPMGFPGQPPAKKPTSSSSSSSISPSTESGKLTHLTLNRTTPAAAKKRLPTRRQRQAKTTDDIEPSPKPVDLGTISSAASLPTNLTHTDLNRLLDDWTPSSDPAPSTSGSSSSVQTADSSSASDDVSDDDTSKQSSFTNNLMTYYVATRGQSSTSHQSQPSESKSDSDDDRGLNSLFGNGDDDEIAKPAETAPTTSSSSSRVTHTNSKPKTRSVDSSAATDPFAASLSKKKPSPAAAPNSKKKQAAERNKKKKSNGKQPKTPGLRSRKSLSNADLDSLAHFINTGKRLPQASASSSSNPAATTKPSLNLDQLDDGMVQQNSVHSDTTDLSIFENIDLTEELGKLGDEYFAPQEPDSSTPVEVVTEPESASDISTMSQWEKNQALLTAITKTDLQQINNLLNAGADINAKDCNGISVVLAAIIYPKTDEESAQILEIIFKSGQQCTSIHARLHGNSNSPSLAEVVGEIPLTLAAKKNKPKTADILLQNGADIYGSNYKGQVAILVAKNHSSQETETLLSGYLAVARNRQAATMRLHNIIIGFREGIDLDNLLQDVRTEIENGADINGKNLCGISIVTAAVIYPQTDEVSAQLLEIIFKSGQKSITINDHLPASRRTIKEECEAAGETALTLAAKNNKPRTAAILLENGADITYTNRAGQTALALATGLGHQETVVVLNPSASHPSTSSSSLSDSSSRADSTTDTSYQGENVAQTTEHVVGIEPVVPAPEQTMSRLTSDVTEALDQFQDTLDKVTADHAAKTQAEIAQADAAHLQEVERLDAEAAAQAFPGVSPELQKELWDLAATDAPQAKTRYDQAKKSNPTLADESTLQPPVNPSMTPTNLSDPDSSTPDIRPSQPDPQEDLQLDPTQKASMSLTNKIGAATAVASFLGLGFFTGKELKAAHKAVMARAEEAKITLTWSGYLKAMAQHLKAQVKDTKNRKKYGIAGVTTVAFFAGLYLTTK